MLRLSLVVSLLAALACACGPSQAELEKASADKAAAQAAAHEAALNALPGQVAEVTNQVAAADIALQQRDLLSARAALEKAGTTSAGWGENGLANEPSAAAAGQQLAARKPHVEALDAFISAQGLAAGTDYLKADEEYERAITALGTLQADYPNKESASQLAADVNKARKKIAKKVAKAKKEQEELQALVALCGQQPRPDPWDAGLIEVERFMKDRAHDPDSIDVENCTMPRLTKQCWQTTCIVRGNNAFGAKVANQYTFYVSSNPAPSGTVLAMD